MRLPLFAIIFICSCASLTGQKKTKEITPFYTYTHELGINVTNVLGNVLSLNPNNANSPYGLTYRRHWQTASFRSALNFRFFSDESSDFAGGNFQLKELKNTSIDIRAGLEKHYALSKNFLFSYGADILAGYQTEFSSVDELTSSGINQFFSSDEQSVGIGAGPVLRLEYKITPHLFVSTECSFYGYVKRTSQQLSINGVISEEPVKSDYNIELQLPQSLFLNISF